jgi:hypothetical protein
VHARAKGPRVLSHFDGRFRFLVALVATPDLLLCAKHLFAAARTVQRGQGGHHGAKAIGSAWADLAIT